MRMLETCGRCQVLLRALPRSARTTIQRVGLVGRFDILVGARGFEPPTTCTPCGGRQGPRRVIPIPRLVNSPIFPYTWRVDRFKTRHDGSPLSKTSVYHVVYQKGTHRADRQTAQSP